MIMIVNPGTIVVARNPTTVSRRREDGRKAVTATAKATEKAARNVAAAVVSPAGGIHQARAASIKGVAASQAAVDINPAAVINQAAAIKVDRAITKAGNARAATAEARTKATT